MLPKRSAWGQYAFSYVSTATYQRSRRAPAVVLWLGMDLCSASSSCDCTMESTLGREAGSGCSSDSTNAASCGRVCMHRGRVIRMHDIPSLDPLHTQSLNPHAVA